MLKIFGTLVCLKFYIKNFILVCDWQTFVRERRTFIRERRTCLSARGRHICPGAADMFVREWRTFVRERRTCPRRTLSAGGRLSAEYYFDEDFFRKIFADFVRGGQLSAADNCPRRTLADIGQNVFGGHWRTFLADFLADCPRVDGGPDRIRSDPPRTLADFLSPHKVRQSPPESAKKRSSADTGADSGGQWRTQADPIGSAADSGGQLSANIKPNTSLLTD